MKLPRGRVGVSAGPRVHEIDARWLMAYAAGLGETDDAYFDTLRPEGILPHPLFPVCYEWPLALEIRARTLPEEVALRGVHATHDLRIHRPPRAGDRLSTTAIVTRVEPRHAGAYVATRYETVDARGEPVTATDHGSIYLGVECEPEGAPTLSPHPPLSPTGGEGASNAPLPSRERAGVGGEDAPAWSAEVPIAATLAHVYTECARIWNPIHTDRAVARRAGLPDIILHGTATLALAVSRALAREGLGAAARVTRVGGRFTAMVPMPSTLAVQGRPEVETADGRWLPFRALAADGRAAVRDGFICLARSR